MCIKHCDLGSNPHKPPDLFALLWPSYFNPLNLPYEIHLSLFLVPIQLHSYYLPPRRQSEDNYEVWWHPMLAKLYQEHKLLTVYSFFHF